MITLPAPRPFDTDTPTDRRILAFVEPGWGPDQPHGWLTVQWSYEAWDWVIGDADAGEGASLPLKAPPTHWTELPGDPA
jgi:hypothetical protein